MRAVMRAAAVVGILALSSAASAQTDPQVGTWKLNLAKSKYNGGTAPKSSAVVVETADGGKTHKLTAKGVLAGGTPRTITYTARCAGNDAAATGAPAYNSA